MDLRANQRDAAGKSLENKIGPIENPFERLIIKVSAGRIRPKRVDPLSGFQAQMAGHSDDTTVRKAFRPRDKG